MARTELSSEEPMATAMYRGKQAIYVSVWPLPGTNEIDVSNRLRDAMEELGESLPSHIDIQLAYDGTKFMRKSLAEISKTLAETILIVGLVVFLFMGSLRTALVPLVAMPVSLVGATIVMLLMGFSMNLLTLLAIVLAVGLVVDDAIVVVENVQRHIQNGHGRIHAALIGARELVGPVIAMTITLATVYAPIGFQGGLTGMLFREFAFTLAAAVVVSGIVAVTLSPIMSAYVIPEGGREGWMTRRVNALFDWIKRGYGRLLQAVFGLRYSIALATLLAGVAAVPLYLFSSRELAPVEDEGAISVILSASPDSTLSSSTRWAGQLAEGFQGIPETDYMWAVVTAGGGFGGVITTDWEERERDTQAILPDVFMTTSLNPGLEAFPVLVPPLPGAGSYDVELVMKSDLPVQRQRELADQIVTQAREAGLFLFVDCDLKVDLPQARVVIDRERLADLGLDQATVGRELGVLLGGGYVNRFNYFNRSYRVIPQLEAADRQSSSSLMDLRIRGPGGELIPVSTFASIEPETAPRTLSRFQQQSAVRIYAAVFPGITKNSGLETL
ncbi:MAG: efflux RND transporter permease subunit, partial [Planctomycetota bacterium]